MERSRAALLEQARQLGENIPFASIENIDAIDERIAWVSVYFTNIVGMNRGFIEFCPNDTPASDSELLGILWVVKPSLAPLIAAHTDNEEFKKMIRAFDYAR